MLFGDVLVVLEILDSRSKLVIECMLVDELFGKGGGVWVNCCINDFEDSFWIDINIV